MIKLKGRLIGVWVGFFRYIQLTATQTSCLLRGRELREVLGQSGSFLALGGAGQELGAG